MFEAPELRQLLEAAQDQLRCMILLGANAGFGNWDVATLPIGTVDLQAGWIDFPRPKTGIARRCPLWPETAAALSETLAARKEPWDKQYAGVLFLTEKRRPWLTDPRNETRLVRRFRELLERLDLYRPGRGFYGLRHTFQTIGDETGDYLAVKRIMGHADGSISDAYRERFPDARLRAVAEHVRAWLFGEQEGGAA
jgi:integrase